MIIVDLVVFLKVVLGILITLLVNFFIVQIIRFLFWKDWKDIHKDKNW